MKARIALIGPHGVGKSSLARELVAKQPGSLRYELEQLVTSRARRSDEGDDEYQFVSQATFDAQRDAYLMVQENRGVAWNYALPTDRLLQDGTARLYTVIPETAAFLRTKFASETLICAVLPPSVEVLVDRLHGRDSRADSQELALRKNLAVSDTALALQLADVVFHNYDGIARSAQELANILEQNVNPVG